LDIELADLQSGRSTEMELLEMQAEGAHEGETSPKSPGEKAGGGGSPKSPGGKKGGASPKSGVKSPKSSGKSPKASPKEGAEQSQGASQNLSKGQSQMNASTMSLFSVPESVPDHRNYAGYFKDGVFYRSDAFIDEMPLHVRRNVL
jgi:hypothetical protein